MAAAAAPALAEGQVVRLVALKLTQSRHTGALAAVQMQLPSSQWRVRLPTGDAVDVPSDCIKPIDAADRFAEGQVVRVHGVAVRHPKLEGALVAVQEYIPLKDSWRVLTPGGERYEFYGENLKVLDSAEMYAAGEQVRVVGVQHSLQLMQNNKIAAVQEYIPLKDMWRVVLHGGQKHEFYSENLRRLSDASLYTEGDLVVVRGTSNPVAIQQYIPATDQWRVRLPTGAAQDIFPENIRRLDDSDAAFRAAAAPAAAPSRGGIMGRFRRGSGTEDGSTGTHSGENSPTPAGGGMFSRMKNAFTRGGYSGEATRGAFKEGDMVHLCGLMRRADGTIAVAQEWLEKKGKWRVRLSSGDAVEVASENLRPAADPSQFATGQLVRVTGSGKRAVEGKTVAVQEIVEAKGMWKVLLPSGEAHEVWPSAMAPVDGGSQDADEQMLRELQELLSGAGLQLSEVAGYSDDDLTELLRDELKVGVVKRNRMKEAVRRSAGSSTHDSADRGQHVFDTLGE
eukprot:TRINITY_DN5983_c0_g1_i1.p1 TRINITY_DN5983_c0_g1~~TRINITY_DN5983_c0_g1_i1.p1  ORF type:complete len:509 (+),score=153.62 TRINITY_DN5983_c0_g1_i1:68-1594(+)